jgi:hypothetical protein
MVKVEIILLFVLFLVFIICLGNKKFIYAKGGIVKREMIAAATVLLLTFATPALAVEEVQPSAETETNFEQIKANSLKRIDDRINTLKEEKTCVEGAKNKSELQKCAMKSKRSRRVMGNRFKKSSGTSQPETQVPSEEK